jgi:aspartyl-tRNA(Asn)/glutamyl-tRNA(Gln) amidotransferase subunit B
VQWQIDTIENGGKVQQATVLFNPDTGETRAMRSKEDAHDYRYFPDPDLLPLEISQEWINKIRATLPELPIDRKLRFMAQKDEEYRKQLRHDVTVAFNQVIYGLSEYDANLLVANKEVGDYLDDCASIVGSDNAKLCANWIIGEVSAQLNRDGLDITQCPISAQQLGGMLARIADGTISNSGAKEVFRTMWADGGDADVIIAAKGLKQVSDAGAIEKIVDEIMAANADKVAEYRSGKDKLFGFFVGLAMKASKGQANPAQLNDVLKKKLAG